MTALALTVLLSSLLGSLHCAAMCGGLVAFCAGGSAPAGGWWSARTQVAYSAGRLAGYATLGALAGALGAAVDLVGALGGVQRGAAAAAGGLIALWGAALVQALGARLPWAARSPRPGLLLARGLKAVASRPPAIRALVIGLLTGCLPCGWLYAFVVTAAGTASALGGAALMIVFWLGTLPVMTMLGAGLGALAGPLRRHVPVACAIAMIVVGLAGVAGRARVIDLAHGRSQPPAAFALSPVPVPHGSGSHGR